MTAEKYHISPTTGNPNRCYAKKACPLGASDKEHYPSKEAARKAFEKSSKVADSFGSVSKKKAPAKSAPTPTPESKKVKSSVTDEDGFNPDEVDEPDLDELETVDIDLDSDLDLNFCSNCERHMNKKSASGLCSICEADALDAGAFDDSWNTYGSEKSSGSYTYSWER